MHLPPEKWHLAIQVLNFPMKSFYLKNRYVF